MKKLLSLLAIALISQSLSAQKITINEIDKFTGNKIVETSIIKINRPRTDIKLVNINDSIYINLHSNDIPHAINDKDSIQMIIVFKDGGKLNIDGVIKSVQERVSSSNSYVFAGTSIGKSRKFYIVDAMLQLTPNALAVLCDKNIADIRIVLADNNMDYSIDEFTSPRFKKMFNLMK